MSKISQKDAVYNAVTKVLAQNKITVTAGTDVNRFMSKELRAQVNQVLFNGFRDGSVELNKDLSDSELKGYVSGLQSNWLRKDSRLNGGSKYSVKNPGSRVGSSDASLKAMRTLLKTLNTESDKAEVQAAISKRVSEIQASKTKSITIDTSVLPPELAAKFVK